MRKLLVFLVPLVSLMSGCATGIKSPTIDNEVRQIKIVNPIKHEIGYTSLTVGGIFGLVGILAEQALTKDTATLLTSKLTAKTSQEQLMNESIGVGTPYLVRLYPTANIARTDLPEAKKYPSVTEWFDVEGGLTPSSKGERSLSVEIGYRVEVVRQNGGLFAVGFVGIKIIDEATGSVVGKNYSNTATGVKLEINENETDPTIIAEESDRAVRILTRDLTTKAFEKLR